MNETSYEIRHNSTEHLIQWPQRICHVCVCVAFTHMLIVKSILIVNSIYMNLFVLFEIVKTGNRYINLKKNK
jgi:hypothetical protein